jgi:hypothetical protein
MVNYTRDVAAAAFWIPAVPTIVVIHKQGVVRLVSNVVSTVLTRSFPNS